MKKLIYFLTNWYTWHAAPSTGKRKRTATKSTTDPSQFRAVLLTGPPGVGKFKNLSMVVILIFDFYLKGKQQQLNLSVKH
jgi:hypothetical protein